MPTITTSTLTPPAVVAAWQVDDWATVDGVPAHEWLARYWTARIRAVRPEPHDDDAHGALVELAHALATEDVTDAVWRVQDYRIFTNQSSNDPTLTRMMLECLLDWSKWTGRINIDDTRAESWLRSLLA